MRTLSIVALCSLFLSSAFAQNGAWKVSKTKNEMDNTTVSAAVLPSDNLKGVVLIVRCMKSKLDVFVSTEGVVDDEYGVRVKFDSGQPLEQSWYRADSYDALFARDSVSIARQLKTTKRFLFEFHPYQSIAKTAIFSVVGLPTFNECPIQNAEAAERTSP